MVFDSVSFLFVFLPALFLLFSLVKGRARSLLLTILSLLFCYFAPSGGWICLLLVAILGLLSYFSGIFISSENKKISVSALAVTVSISVALMIVFKISVQTGAGAFPFGLSFISFGAIAYAFDIYRKKIKPEKDALAYFSFFTFFGKIGSGPITPYSKELSIPKRDLSLIYESVIRFTCGLFKKAVLADSLSLLCANLLAQKMGAVDGWLYAVSASLWIYFDFSGYSDMAIALGGIFGYRLPENFNYPFVSASIKEFFQRWHISLSSFFKNYVYIPLGGNRKGKFRTEINLFAVWLLTGLWHGFSLGYIVWGLAYWVLLSIEKNIPEQIKKAIPRPFKILSVLFITINLFVVFSFPDLVSSFGVFKAMFGSTLTAEHSLYNLSRSLVLVLVCALLSTPIVSVVRNYLAKTKIGGVILAFAEPIFVLLALAVSLSYITNGTFAPNLYAGF